MGFQTSYLVNEVIKTKDELLIAKMDELLSYQFDLFLALGGDPASFASLQGAILTTNNLKLLYPMQETSGDVVSDISPKGLHGVYDGVALANTSPYHKIKNTVGFKKSSFIKLPKEASVRGLNSYTFMAVVKLNDTGQQNLYFEPTNTDIGKARFQVSWNFTSGQFDVHVRSGKSTQTSQHIITNDVIPEGFCILHVTVDIANNEINIYRNGILLSATGTVDFGGATSVENTEPKNGDIFFGRIAETNYFNFMGESAYLSLFERKLTNDEILNQVKRAGL